MKKFIKIVNFFLIIISLILSFFIFKNKGNSFSFFYQLSTLLLPLKTNHSYSSTVSCPLPFQSIDQDMYTNTDSKVYCPLDGVIYYVSNDEILLSFRNGFYGKFYHLQNINASRFDLVDKNMVLASFDSYFYFYAFDGEKHYTYEQLFK